ncbi:MAG TPA: cytochrome-c peroxidase [Polyangiaceae bacterium]|nr:cytochrome-c peroxidase [Polyangiaceae bacterium]
MRRIGCDAGFGGSAALLAALLALGCDSFSTASEAPPPIGVGVGSGGSTTVNTGGSGPGFPSGVVDSRTVAVSSRTPPSISGGTLLALSDGRTALVSDPDRDKITLVDFIGNFFPGVITLEEGAEPGRAVEDKSGHAYVVLRGTGEVLTIDLASATAGERRKVCALPRGIALGADGQRLIVACAEGKLVDLPLSGSATLVETKSSVDVRDVVVSNGRTFVSRFRSAELLALDANLSVQSIKKLPSVADTFRGDQFSSVPGVFDAEVAWRSVPGPDGSVVMVHQRATSDDIVIDSPNGKGDTGSAGGPDTSDPGIGGGESTYGGAVFTGCGGIVHSAITVVQEDGTVITSPQLGGVVLPVDVAVSSNGVIAVASAGPRDAETPSLSPRLIGASSISLLTAPELDRATMGTCLSTSFTVPVTEPVVAVAFDPGGRLLAQTREPSKLIIIDNVTTLATRTIDLPGESRLDTGHEIFHRDAGGGIACASCHVEGTDDGRTWHFQPFGARRTQAIDVGLAGTEPFHWDGTLPTMDHLMSEVFVGRMGGPGESPKRVEAVQNWIFQLKPRAPLRAGSDPAAQRGMALFESREVGCTSCHSGAKFTNNTTVDVGTGGNFQVPSLLGIAQRVPVMHNGCAATLMDRFDASCGGTAHGNTSQLSRAELEDLVAFLESI